MNKIDKLINDLCPNGVDYYPLNKFIDYIQPTKYIVNSTNYNNEFNIPVLTAGQTFVLGYTNEVKNTYKATKERPVIIFDDFTTSNHWVDFEFKVKSSALKILVLKENNVNFRYLFYCIQNMKYIPMEHSRQWIQTFSLFKIPIPPLEVQDQIVDILDKFVELGVELEEELDIRRKQYEIYENELIFNKTYDEVLLKDVCTVNQGLQIPISQRKKKPGKNRYFYITVQFLKGNNEKYYIENPQNSVICHEDDILVTRTGSTGKIITGIAGCFHNNFFKVICSKNIYKRYLYYVLKSKKMYNKMLFAASGGTVPDLPHNSFYKLKIPLPSLQEQKRIVNILDKFDKLTNDISEGLPAEIEMRRKQYEYYRNKLLTFEEISYE